MYVETIQKFNELFIDFLIQFSLEIIYYQQNFFIGSFLNISEKSTRIKIPIQFWTVIIINHMQIHKHFFYT